jgi:antitoxin (DNA-binding transcriptional repressor) of toxin-antitoxin stability system
MSIYKKKSMKKIVGLKELRENMETYATRVSKGESFIIVKKSKPLFSINPLDTEELWETVIDFAKIRKGGVSLEDILKKL